MMFIPNKNAILKIENEFLILLNSFITTLHSILVLSRSDTLALGVCMYELKIRLNSASVAVEVEAELRNSR